jgi:hypothetical protein
VVEAATQPAASTQAESAEARAAAPVTRVSQQQRKRGC